LVCFDNASETVLSRSLVKFASVCEKNYPFPQGISGENVRLQNCWWTVFAKTLWMLFSG